MGEDLEWKEATAEARRAVGQLFEGCCDTETESLVVVHGH